MPTTTPPDSRVTTSYLQAWDSAIATDNAEQAADLLQDSRVNGWNPRTILGTDGSWLVRAAGEGAHRVVKLLMPLSDLNQVDSDGLSALMRAAKEGHVAVINALLATLPWPPSAPTPDTSATAPAQGDLLTATSMGQPLNLLIEDHENHRTALHWAAQGGHVGAVTALLPYLPATTLGGMNTLALHDAADDGEVRVLDLLLPFGGTNHQDDAGWTPIMYAAINNRRTAVKRLAPLTDLTLRNHEEDSVLDIARQRGVSATVRHLEAETQRQEAEALRQAMEGTVPLPAPGRPRL